MRIAIPVVLLASAVLTMGPACVNGPAPLDRWSPDELVRTLERLHTRVYDVYDLAPDRDAVHDLLSGSFTGRQLTEEYIEHYTTLYTMREERTAIDVLSVDYEEVTVTSREPGRVWLDAAWNVGGVVSHRGHKHVRINRYRALFALEERGGELRIAQTRVRDSERVRSTFSSGEDLFGDGSSSAGGMMSLEQLIEAGVGLPEPPGDAGADGTALCLPASAGGLWRRRGAIRAPSERVAGRSRGTGCAARPVGLREVHPAAAGGGDPGAPGGAARGGGPGPDAAG